MESTMSQCHDYYEPQSVQGPARPGLVVTERQVGKARVLQLEGTLNWATCPALRDWLKNAVQRDLIIDLSRANLDSSGTGALLAGVARAQRRGQRVVVISFDRLQHEVFAFTGLCQVVPVVASQKTALAILAGHPSGPLPVAS